MGFTPETVILSYLFAKPKNFVILHTKESEHLLETVLKYTKVPLADFYHEPLFSDTNVVYKALEKAIQRFSKEEKIAIELTGGKKTIAGVLAAAAGKLDIDLFYIDYFEYMPAFKKPKPESSYIHLVEHPMKLSIDLFGGIEIKRAVDYFNLGKYNVSKELFEQAGNQMANPRLANICSKLSEFYDYWNSFNFLKAVGLSEELFESILQFHDQISNQFNFDITQFKSQLEIVKKLSSGDRVYQIWNFYFTALRNEKNKLNDIAVLLYYRTIESVFENALKDIVEDFDRSNPNYFLLNNDIEELRKEYVKCYKTVYSNVLESKPLPNKIALFDSLCILKALDCRLAKVINLKRVANVAQKRNLSVYVHGSNLVEKDTLEAMKKLAIRVVNKYSEIKKEKMGTLDSEVNRFEFIQLKLKSRGFNAI